MGDLRYPWAAAWVTASGLCEALRPACERIEIAGSLRRRKPDVGDIEILYVPRTRVEPDPEDLFATCVVNVADRAIAELEREGILGRRPNALGRETYGDRNKLMVHLPSGIPVDLFATTADAWFNYLVCRTGPAESNKRIAAAALALGCHWHPYEAGFGTPDGMRKMDSEADVFAFVGLPYAEPPDRQ